MSISSRSVAFINSKVANTELILKNYAGIMESEAKINANPQYWKTGFNHATQGIHSGVENTSEGFKLYLGHSMKYGKFLEEGTAPHLIRAKNKPYLHFKASNGNWVKTKEVKHPGTAPRPLLEDTIKNNIDSLRNDLLNEWERPEP